MNPKAEIFFDAITLLPEDVVEEAQNYRFRKKQSGWKKAGSLAACLALIASLSLLMLPRGCGAGGGNADRNTSGAPMVSTDSCAPADAPVSGEPAPEPGEAPDAPEGGYDYGQAETVQFTAVVLEVNDGSILVEPLAGEHIRSLCDQIVVTVGDLELPELAVGDKVRVTCDGLLLDSDPAYVPGAEAVELLAE